MHDVFYLKYSINNQQWHSDTYQMERGGERKRSPLQPNCTKFHSHAAFAGAYNKMNS